MTDHHGTPVVTGIVTAVVGFSSSFVVVLAGLAAVGATPDQAASGILAMARELEAAICLEPPLDVSPNRLFLRRRRIQLKPRPIDASGGRQPTDVVLRIDRVHPLPVGGCGHRRRFRPRPEQTWGKCVSIDDAERDLGCKQRQGCGQNGGRHPEAHRCARRPGDHGLGRAGRSLRTVTSGTSSDSATSADVGWRTPYEGEYQLSIISNASDDGPSNVAAPPGQSRRTAVPLRCGVTDG